MRGRRSRHLKTREGSREGENIKKKNWTDILYTAISRMVVGEKCARDNPER